MPSAALDAGPIASACYCRWIWRRRARGCSTRRIRIGGAAGSCSSGVDKSPSRNCMNIFRRLLLVFPAVLLFASGCEKKTPPPPPAGHALTAPLVAQCEPGQPGGRLTLAIVGAPITFNPLLATDCASDELLRLL